MKYNHTKQEVEEVVRLSKSIATVCKKLGIKAKGGNYQTLKNKFKLWSIDTSHFTGQGWNVGLTFKPRHNINLNLILVENSTYTSTQCLKGRLLKEGFKIHSCEICKLDTWLDNKIPLELHHVNGNKTDNRIENIKLLCPNCHALTENYRGKNIGKNKMDCSTNGCN